VTGLQVRLGLHTETEPGLTLGILVVSIHTIYGDLRLDFPLLQVWLKRAVYRDISGHEQMGS
jgi:hypothetical protein